MPRTLSADTLPPSAQAGLTQAGAVLLAIVPLAAGLEMSLLQWAVVQGAIAMRIASLSGAAQWWPPLHLLFLPAVVWAQTLKFAPGWWAAAFVVLLLSFGSTFRTQVPLFLTSQRVRARLAELIEAAGCRRFIDLGCGLGSVIAAVKRGRPQCECDGVELAFLPYLISRLRVAASGCRVQRRDFMQVDLSGYDVVYAFLSPAPMPQLWAKARREMRPGSLFVSLAFAVPGVAPERVIDVSERERHTLYVWRM